ncbi:MAG: restriction endonuclease subunit S [Cyanobacteria bacterium MAG CAR3_bin_5]|nr:restriction endonuclease subunit S [Cyanobacteria bacterium MAG CAR3_bin_5]
MSSLHLKSLKELCRVNPETLDDSTNPWSKFRYIDLSSVRNQKIDLCTEALSFKQLPSRARRKIKQNDVLLGTVRPNLKNFAFIDSEADDLVCSTGFAVLRSRERESDPNYIFHVINSDFVGRQLNALVTGSNYPAVNANQVAELLLPAPPLLEQKKIAEILSGIDKIIARYSQKREKLSKLRSALRSDLLSGRKGSWGMSEWPSELHMQTLGESCDIHDSKRIPLSSEQRQTRKGEYPYYGANNIQDYIDAYLFDFDAVLLAEDGGYYDEYQSRPIAQFATGKYWVNNHAHILTGKTEMDIRFLFYSLIHKNILSYINTGTRSKLNQSELKQIEILVPPLPEQKKIAEILSGVDHQMATLLDAEKKYVSLKQAIAADLLSGRKRVSV